MATSNGRDGAIQACATGGTAAAIGTVKNYTLEESTEGIDVTALGDSTKKRDAGLKDWSVNVEVYYDPSDTAQAELINGTKVDLVLFPQGETTGKPTRSGTGLITSVSEPVEIEGKVMHSLSIEADGALTNSVVS